MRIQAGNAAPISENQLSYLFFLSAVDAGGISVYLRGLAEQLMDAGLDVCVVLYHDCRSSYFIKNTPEGFRCRTVEVVFDSLDKKSKAGQCIAGQLVKGEFMCFAGDGSPWCREVVKVFRSTTFVLYFEIVHSDLNSWYCSLRKVVEDLDFVCAVSSRIARAIRQYVPGVSVEVCYPAVSGPIGIPDQATDGVIHLCFIGRMAKEKRPLDLVPICRTLQLRGIPYRLAVIGGGRELEVLQSELESESLSSKVSVLGKVNRSRVIEVLKTQDVLLLLSEYEGFPLVLGEAMSCGVIPVSTNVSGAEDMIEEGVSGYLVEVGDVAGFVDRIKRLYDDPIGRHRMSDACLVQARSFSAEVQVGCFLSAIGRAIHRPRPILRSRNWSSGGGLGSILDGPWVPNGMTRMVRKLWRWQRGAPSDVGKGRQPGHARYMQMRRANEGVREIVES